MLSRIGQCSSYDDVQAMDTSIANAIITKSDIFGVVLPSNISTGVYRLQVTKMTKMKTHFLAVLGQHKATTLILFQRCQFGPASKLQV